MEPLVGLEPTTIRLQGECSTNWAKVAAYTIYVYIVGKLGYCIKKV